MAVTLEDETMRPEFQSNLVILFDMHSCHIGVVYCLTIILNHLARALKVTHRKGKQKSQQLYAADGQTQHDIYIYSKYTLCYIPSA